MIKITEHVQRLADEQFVGMVANMLDLYLLGQRIVDAYGGWPQD